MTQTSLNKINPAEVKTRGFLIIVPKLFKESNSNVPLRETYLTCCFKPSPVTIGSFAYKKNKNTDEGVINKTPDCFCRLNMFSYLFIYLFFYFIYLFIYLFIYFICSFYCAYFLLLLLIILARLDYYCYLQSQMIKVSL